ncbi:MAG: hypothetical protein RIR12_1277 [Bacteroidota bacterium]|jgi:hydroxymethylbilane synthase
MQLGSNSAHTIKLIGRASRLSLLQLQLVKDKIRAAYPSYEVEIITKNSRGDALQNISLHTVEGSDFFTQAIFKALENAEADIAVHSLKDMSGEHFFGENYFAVVDRDDTRDVAIFNANVETKIRTGQKLIIGTCSPRREEMAMHFLKKALPQLHREIKIDVKPIRGNVETRLRKINNGEYDATILATAGINRLLRSNQDADLIKQLLHHKKVMVLPLIECVPAPCQGAIVAEAHTANERAIEILKQINTSTLYEHCYREKKCALSYGSGCIQKFGVTTITTANEKYLYAAGKDAADTSFIKWQPLPQPIDGTIFSSTDVMKDFFEYEWESEALPSIVTKAIFVANYKAVQNCRIELQEMKCATQGTLTGVTTADKQIIIAAGTRTWFELAKQGYWVSASADALGFEFLLPSLSMPLININKEDVTIITHNEAAERWKSKGYKAVSNYTLQPKKNLVLQNQIAEAGAIFWSSFSQYQYFGKYAKPAAKHLCAGGETAHLLQQQGLQPIIFPTIKSFELWRKNIFPLPSGE